MSFNAKLRINIPKSINYNSQNLTSRIHQNSYMNNNLITKRDENIPTETNNNYIGYHVKKPVKSTKIETKVRSRLNNGERLITNENDRNVTNLHKEIFSKKIINEERNENKSNKKKNGAGNNHQAKKIQPIDLNVTMRSCKDDSGLKTEAEKISRENVLGSLVDNEPKIGTKEGLPKNDKKVAPGSFVITEHNDLSKEVITTKENKDSKNKKNINSNNTNSTLHNTIKQVNLSTDINSNLNFENLSYNKENPPKFTKEEYRNMFSFLIRKDYSKSILSNLFSDEESTEEFLSNHKITERMRCRMVDWMIEVLSNYHCDDNSFFQAIGLMDRFFLMSKNTLQPSELHLIGVTAMFMASKYQDIYPLRLKIIHEKIAHKKLSAEEIKGKEEEISKILNYIFGKPTQLEFISHFLEEMFSNNFNNYYIKDKSLTEKYLPDEEKCDTDIFNLFNKIYTSNMLNLLKHVTVYLAKMNCHDYQLTGKKPSLLAASTIFVAMKICEQINKEEYVNDYITKRLTEISRKSESEIIKCAQKILYNAQNFDSLYTGLENLKKVHFNAIIELKNTK